MGAQELYDAYRTNVFGGKAVGAIGVVKFLCAHTRGPGGTEGRQHALNLVAVHAVAALIGPAARRVLDAAAGNGFLDDVGEFADAVVFLGAAHVEGLIVNGVLGSVQDANHGLDDVADVHDG